MRRVRSRTSTRLSPSPCRSKRHRRSSGAERRAALRHADGRHHARAGPRLCGRELHRARLRRCRGIASAPPASARTAARRLVDHDGDLRRVVRGVRIDIRALDDLPREGVRPVRGCHDVPEEALPPEIGWRSRASHSPVVGVLVHFSLGSGASGPHVSPPPSSTWARTLFGVGEFSETSRKT